MDPTLVSAGVLLFDMDGTLVDSSRGVEREWARWAAERGVDRAVLDALRHGVRTAEVVARLCPQLDADAEAAAIETRMLAVAAEPIDGVRALYDATAAERRAIVTSATPAMAEGRLAEQGIAAPATLVTAGDVARGKPDPAPYLLAARRLGASPDACLVVEDAPPGIASARAAGMRVLAVLTTHARDDLADADLVVAPQDAIRGAQELGF